MKSLNNPKNERIGGVMKDKINERMENEAYDKMLEDCNGSGNVEAAALSKTEKGACNDYYACQDYANEGKKACGTCKVKEKSIELFLDEGVMIDLMERYEGNDDWNMFYFAIERHIEEKVKEIKAKQRADILARFPKEIYIRDNPDIDDLGDMRYNEAIASVRKAFESEGKA